MTGITLSSSSFRLTADAPGRVDSPPMSIIPAPFSTIDLACSIAKSESKNLPPSEKESGVTLRTPIMIGWLGFIFRAIYANCSVPPPSASVFVSDEDFELFESLPPVPSSDETSSESITSAASLIGILAIRSSI